MSNPTPTQRPSAFRRFWKPVAATSTGGTAVAIWFEEMIAIVAEIIGLILVIVLGGLIILFNHFLFKFRLPRREDFQNPTRKGE